MQYSGFDFLGFAHIPEVFAQITAGTTNNSHLGVVLIVASGAFPLIIIVNGDFAIKAAHMAVVGFGIKFSVLNIVIDEFDNLFQGFGIVTHIGNFYIGNSAAGGNLLELAFKFKFAEGIDFFAHINVVGVGVVALIGYILDGAEASLVHASEAIAEALGGGAIKAEAQTSFSLPFFAGTAQTIHHAQSKFFALGGGVADALHELGYLVETNITQGNGGITIF